MMGLTNNLRAFSVIEACDMRKSFSGRAAIAEDLKPASLKGGALFLFISQTLQPGRRVLPSRRLLRPLRHRRPNRVFSSLGKGKLTSNSPRNKNSEPQHSPSAPVAANFFQ